MLSSKSLWRSAALTAVITLGVGAGWMMTKRVVSVVQTTELAERKMSEIVRVAVQAEGNGNWHVDLGKLPLGSTRDIVLEVIGLRSGIWGGSETSCACLRMEAVEGVETSPNALLNARYFAVRSGKVEVTLQANHLDGEGKSTPFKALVTGEVEPGEAVLAARLQSLVQLPMVSSESYDRRRVAEPSRALAAIRAREGFLIDVRSEEEFLHNHAEESVNIPLARLAPSGAFRGRDLYLIGPVLVTGAMQKACVQLKRQGVSEVFVVPGGVQAWQAAGGKIFQELDPAPVIGSLSLQDLTERTAEQHCTMAGLALPDAFTFQYCFPDSVNWSGIEEMKRGIDAKLGLNPTQRIVLMDASGQGYGLLNQAAPAQWLGKVYYLQAGFPDYLAEMTRLAALASAPPSQQTASVHGFAKRQGLHQPHAPTSSGCGTCPK